MSIPGSIKQFWRVGAAASFERAGSCRWKRSRGECSERFTARYFTTSHCGRCGREITTKSKWGVADTGAIAICFAMRIQWCALSAVSPKEAAIVLFVVLLSSVAAQREEKRRPQSCQHIHARMRIDRTFMTAMPMSWPSEGTKKETNIYIYKTSTATASLLL